MQDVTRIGIDLGKHSFHVHGQHRHGKADSVALFTDIGGGCLILQAVR